MPLLTSKLLCEYCMSDSGIMTVFIKNLFFDLIIGQHGAIISSRFLPLSFISNFIVESVILIFEIYCYYYFFRYNRFRPDRYSFFDSFENDARTGNLATYNFIDPGYFLCFFCIQKCLIMPKMRLTRFKKRERSEKWNSDKITKLSKYCDEYESILSQLFRRIWHSC